MKCSSFHFCVDNTCNKLCRPRSVCTVNESWVLLPNYQRSSRTKYFSFFSALYPNSVELMQEVVTDVLNKISPGLREKYGPRDAAVCCVLYKKQHNLELYLPRCNWGKNSHQPQLPQGEKQWQYFQCFLKKVVSPRKVTQSIQLFSGQSLTPNNLNESRC